MVESLLQSTNKNEYQAETRFLGIFDKGIKSKVGSSISSHFKGIDACRDYPGKPSESVIGSEVHRQQNSWA